MDLAQDTFTTLTVYLSEQLANTELKAEVSALLFGQENECYFQLDLKKKHFSLSCNAF